MALKPVKVSQLNNYIKRILQTDPILGDVSVIGEVSNLKFHSSGHVYFSLKDETSKVNCFLAAGNLSKIDCDLREGMEITAAGYIYLYERGGSYSLNIRHIEENGQGELAAAFERLKSKLEKQGYFDKNHKKSIPSFPRKIAVVTSETGAAVRDMLKIISKKNDYVDILIYPVLVQGPDAKYEISRAIDDLNENHRDVDIIITGRGGGSMEELWAFNEEIVAESIYNSHIPVISAVGHEIDFTISDFVADLRAETPTAAAEMAVPDTVIIRENLNYYRDEMKRNLLGVLENRRKHLEAVSIHAFSREIQSRLVLEQLKTDNVFKEIKDEIDSRVQLYSGRLESLRENIEACNPRTILKKGYSVVTDEKGNIIKDMSRLEENQIVNIEGAVGQASARVINTKNPKER